MKTVIRTLTFAIVAIAMMASCASPKKVAYFQDVANKDTVLQTAIAQALRIQKGDKLMIAVHSRDLQLAALYNLPIVGTRIGMTNSSNYSQGNLSYTVDSNGQIDFPVLGKITVEGMKRDEVAELVQNRLINENLCKDAVVIVEMDNSYVNVLGEVARPGRYPLTKDNMTLFDILGTAGDLNIQGKRENIMVVRTSEKGQASTFILNLNNLEQTVKSPAYYMQEGDVVYVEPNSYRKRQTSVNANNMLSTGFWISVASLTTSIVSLATRR